MKKMEQVLWEIRRGENFILVRLLCGCRVRVPLTDRIPEKAQCNADHSSKKLLRA